MNKIDYKTIEGRAYCRLADKEHIEHDWCGKITYNEASPWVEISKLKKFANPNFLPGDDYRRVSIGPGMICPDCNSDGFVFSSGIDWGSTICSGCNREFAVIHYSWFQEMAGEVLRTVKMQV